MSVPEASGGGPAEPAPIAQAGELRSARIESLRALAAAGVLVGHVYAYSQEGFTGGFLEKVVFGGGFGVFLFFALSGYLLYLPFARQHLGGGDRVDLSGYARNRALRILPLYYVVVITVLVLKENGGSWGEWWRFLLFAENFSLATVTEVNGVLWSLVVELHFYALLPLIAVAAAWLGRGTRLGAGIVLTAMAGASLGVHFAKVRGNDDPSSALWRYSILATFFFFVAGMLVALVRLAWADGRPGWLRGPLASADTWLLASLPIWLFVFDDYSRGPLVAVASMLIVGAATLPLDQGRLVNSLSWRPLAVVGIASYSLYLWHVPLLDLITGEVGVPGGFAGLLAIAAPASLAVALASYVAIEAPFLRLRRRWARSTAPKVSPSGRGGPRAEPTSQPAR